MFQPPHPHSHAHSHPHPRAHFDGAGSGIASLASRALARGVRIHAERPQPRGVSSRRHASSRAPRAPRAQRGPLLWGVLWALHLAIARTSLSAAAYPATVKTNRSGVQSDPQLDPQLDPGESPRSRRRHSPTLRMNRLGGGLLGTSSRMTRRVAARRRAPLSSLNLASFRPPTRRATRRGRPPYPNRGPLRVEGLLQPRRFRNPTTMR